MRFFWFKGANNYGDVMTPFICSRMGIKYTWTKKEEAEAIMIGSIANQAKARMHVFGSGFIRATDPVCVDANYHWVRGQLTRKMILDAGGKCPELYGDAALILPRLINPALKEHDIGYIPHHIDWHLTGGFKVNLTRGSIEHITKQITKCRKVISSSLHGIIVAHAYGIPAAWVKLSDKLSGDGMKFHDHYKSVGLEAIQSTMKEPVFQVPTDIKTDHIVRILKGYA